MNGSVRGLCIIRFSGRGRVATETKRRRLRLVVVIFLIFQAFGVSFFLFLFFIYIFPLFLLALIFDSFISSLSLGNSTGVSEIGVHLAHENGSVAHSQPGDLGGETFKTGGQTTLELATKTEQKGNDGQDTQSIHIHI